MACKRWPVLDRQSMEQYQKNDDRGHPSGWAWRFDFNEGRWFDGDEVTFYTNKRARPTWPSEIECPSAAARRPVRASWGGGLRVSVETGAYLQQRATMETARARMATTSCATLTPESCLGHGATVPSCPSLEASGSQKVGITMRE